MSNPSPGEENTLRRKEVSRKRDINMNPVFTRCSLQNFKNWMTTPCKVKGRIQEQKIQNIGNFCTDFTTEQERKCVVLFRSLGASLITTVSDLSVNNINAHSLLSNQAPI
jgi:hypothetical protein